MPDNGSSRKDFNPKHRIVGAIVLVSLTVIFVPMLLEKRQAPPVSPAVAQLTQIPSAREMMVAETMPSSTLAPATPTATPTATSRPVPVAARPSVRTKALHAAGSHAAAAMRHEEAWFVQVGMFSRAHNAEQVAHALRSHGYAVNLERVALAAGHGLRVRVGPYAHKEQARRAQAEIQRKVGLHGDVRSE